MPHALYHVNSKGVIKKEVALPAELLANEIRFGFEGIARVGDVLWMPVQRPWKDDAKTEVKLVAYNTESEEWGAVRYPLDAPAGKGWVGLSDIEIHGDYAYIIERDNQIGEKAAIKKIYRVAMSQMVPAKLGGELPLVDKEEVRDLLPDLKSLNGYVVDKVEGLAIDADGKAYVVTDGTVQLTAAEVMRFCSARLRGFMVPKAVMFIRDLPKTESGKIKKRELA